MTVRAKTLVKDKFWIVEQNGQKLGTLQKQSDNGWIFLSKQDQRQVFHTEESLFTKFGFNIFENPEIKKGQDYILLVDDDKTTHDVVRRAIKKEGHTVYSCFDGDEGIEQARKVLTKLILLDVLMPGRDEWSVLKELKKDKKLKDIPVVITSVLNEESMANSLGADDYMKKPIDRTFFINIVQRYITEKNQKVL